MDIEKELEMLQALQEMGTLTENEFNSAVEKQVSAHQWKQDQELKGPQAAGLGRYLSQVDGQTHSSSAIQGQLTRLDQQWDLDSRKCFSSHRNAVYLPTKALGLIKLIGGFVFGVVWVVLCQSTEDALAATIFGIVVSSFICWIGYSDFYKAVRYERAKEEYERKRDVLVARLCIGDEPEIEEKTRRPSLVLKTKLW